MDEQQKHVVEVVLEKLLHPAYNIYMLKDALVGCYQILDDGTVNRGL